MVYPVPTYQMLSSAMCVCSSHRRFLNARGCSGYTTSTLPIRTCSESCCNSGNDQKLPPIYYTLSGYINLRHQKGSTHSIRPEDGPQRKYYFMVAHKLTQKHVVGRIIIVKLCGLFTRRLVDQRYLAGLCLPFCVLSQISKHYQSINKAFVRR